MSFNSILFRPSPASRHPTHVRATYTPIVLQCGVAHVGDFLSDQAHPQHEAVEEVRRSFRTLRRTLKFLLAIQLREATRNLQMYLMNSGQLPALDMDFEDE